MKAGRAEDVLPVESAGAMQPDRRNVGGVADHCDHLPVAGASACVDKGAQQRPAEAEAGGTGLDVDRVFDGEAVRGARAERACVGVSEHAIAIDRNQIGVTGSRHRIEPPRHLVEGRWLESKLASPRVTWCP